MKLLTGLLLCSFIVGSVAGCSTPEVTQADVNKRVQDNVQMVELTIDGRRIPCLVWRDGRSNGISCDWSVK